MSDVEKEKKLLQHYRPTTHVGARVLSLDNNGVPKWRHGQPGKVRVQMVYVAHVSHIDNYDLVVETMTVIMPFPCYKAISRPNEPKIYKNTNLFTMNNELICKNKGSKIFNQRSHRTSCR